MRSNYVILWVLTAYFLVTGVLYTIWNILDHGSVEWAGTVTIILSAGLSGFIAYYLGSTHKSQGGELPEDQQTAGFEEGAELGHFSPWSWWPIFLAGSLAIVFLGLAVGIWLLLIGLGVTIVALVGFIYEYYRGNFAR